MSYIKTLVTLALLLVAVTAFACGDDDDEAGLDTRDYGADASDTGAPTGEPVVTDAPANDPEPQTSDCPEPSGEAPEAQVKQYDSAPEMTIDPAKEYLATVKTERGDFVIRMRPDLAPQHVNNFVFLANDGYYDGVTFHRVLDGFMAQAGDPTGTGSGGPGYTIPAEFTTDVAYTRGTLGAARTNDPDSAGSQWFITFGDTPSLNGQYTIFGEVIEGMDVVDCITRRDPQQRPDFEGDKIITIEIAEN